jgi:hypothetical protein
MKFARLSVMVLSVIAIVLASVSPKAHADESIMQIAQNKQEKQIIINFLRDRYTRHQRMTTEQIIADLNASAERNHKMLVIKQQRDTAMGRKAQVPGDTAQSFEKLVMQETDKLRMLGDRDLILAMEAARLQEVMSSDNYMLYIMNHGAPQLAYLVCTCGDPTISIIFAIFLVPFDIVALPIEFLLTAITGF